MDMSDKDEAIERLKEIVATHEKYLEMIDNVEDIFSLAFFMNMFGAIALLSLSAFVSTVRLNLITIYSLYGFLTFCRRAEIQFMSLNTL